jgi:predicted nuclease of predicted toxin-antitoxin system
MILADENIDGRIIATLRQRGYDVRSVRELNRGIRDEEVIELARNPPRLILTEDKDFGEWVFAHHVRDISVILLRYHFSETTVLISVLLEVLEKRGADLRGAFTVLTTQKVRIRPLR